MPPSAGALPNKLEDITVVPVPVDPGSNEPFSYALEAGAPTLDAPSITGAKHESLNCRCESSCEANSRLFDSRDIELAVRVAQSFAPLRLRFLAWYKLRPGPLRRPSRAQKSRNRG